MSEPTPEPAITPEPEQVRDSRSEANSNSPASQSKVIALILAALTLFVFWPVVHFGFINFDDPDYVSNAYVAKGLTLRGMIWAFGTWHPITWISHMFDGQFFGKDPAGPHFVN